MQGPLVPCTIVLLEVIWLYDVFDNAMLMVSHDLPYALELCPRSLLMNEGTLVADGRTRDILSDNGLMSANRLELPYGFDPDFVAP